MTEVLIVAAVGVLTELLVVILITLANRIDSRPLR